MGKKLKKTIVNIINSVRVVNKQKIFCIGRNKTGTTSVRKAFVDLGYVVGKQSDAEKLFPFYKDRNFHPVVEYCETAEAFQDVPFSLPYTYIALDYAFPGSKFILTVRDSPEVWCDSLIRFHSKLYGGNIPTLKQLKNSTYAYKGFMYDARKIVFGTPDDDLYNREIMINQYNEHNRTVMEYFKFRPDDLLVLNLTDRNAYFKFCKFLGREPVYEIFPWENRTDNLVK